MNYLAHAASETGEPLYHVGCCVLEPGEVLTYNNPDELLRIEDEFKRRRSIDVSIDARDLQPPIPQENCRTVREWLRVLEEDTGHLEPTLEDTYGPDEALWHERIDSYRDALVRFGGLYGYDRSTILVRAPGRVNIMGRHVEHRGGNVNVMAINKEVVMAAD